MLMPPNPPGRHGGLEAHSALHVRYTPARYLAVPRSCVAVALLSRWGLGRGAPVCGVPMQSVCRPWQLRAPTPTLVPVAPLHPPPLPCTPDFHTHAALISCAWSHVGCWPLGCFGEGCGGGGRPSPWLAVFEFVCLWVLAVYPPPSPRLARPPPLVDPRHHRLYDELLCRCPCCEQASARHLGPVEVGAVVAWLCFIGFP